MIITSNSNYYSFIIMFPNGKKSISLRISQMTFWIAILILVIAMLSLSVGLYFTSTATYKSQAYSKLEADNKALKNSLALINTNLDQLQTQYTKIIDKEDELKLLLGDVKMKRRSYRQKKKIKKKITKINKDYNNITQIESNPVNATQLKINFLRERIAKNDQVYRFFLEKTYRLKDRFASTPSIRPIYGRIQSGYGMRYHPIHRRKKLHRGIDFASWTGAPIQATADGIIEYAGWSGSFGFVIVIDHDYGYRTIYAHCSQLLVEQGTTVKKGQIIAQVGTTGISTGSHLHYEVKKWRKAVNPVAYLDIDMFEASKKIW